ncbi:phage repressor protein [Novacetimonas maltaceti]|uniref:Helix-turn-helix transcriptional regulator n=1 Tax=Novacetimonas maltaceti TaxID=1203393 RepID=A0A2S3W2W2_9PROT|nr:helix-turn-helix transcriptional regulator [Novacetimonas maltaceti]POF63177.1 hypothetical protein KMAL_12640 [Novacetimonas maltaceti]PYD60634.1 phage repressor protein [Novacetimonas maltaceti]
MISHEDIWRALDLLATERGMTPSGLARAAGLDSTTFNPSKRMTPSGRPRWPGTESLARTLSATGISLEGFGRLMNGHGDRSAGAHHEHLRIVPFSELRQAALFDEAGLPCGERWETWDFHGLADHHSYAVLVDSDNMEPVFRNGAVLVVSPTAAIRQHDRVLLHGPDSHPCCGIVTDRWHDALPNAPLHERIRIRGVGRMEGETLEMDGDTRVHRIAMACL